MEIQGGDGMREGGEDEKNRKGGGSIQRDGTREEEVKEVSEERRVDKEGGMSSEEGRQNMRRRGE